MALNAGKGIRFESGSCALFVGTKRFKLNEKEVCGVLLHQVKNYRNVTFTYESLLSLLLLELKCVSGLVFTCESCVRMQVFHYSSHHLRSEAPPTLICMQRKGAALIGTRAQTELCSV